MSVNAEVSTANNVLPLVVSTSARGVAVRFVIVTESVACMPVVALKFSVPLGDRLKLAALAADGVMLAIANTIDARNVVKIYRL
jgi:hypothetical protein